MRRAFGGGLVALLALSFAASLAGCGLIAPGAGPRPATSRSAATAAAANGHDAAAATRRAAPSARSPSARIAATRRTHELATPAPAPRVSGGWRTPALAVRSFATVYVNWTATTVSTHLRALARASVGQARAELTVQAAEVGRDRELRAGEIANAGTVEAVAPVVGSAREYAVVTRERTSAAGSDAYRGLAPEWHVSEATVTRLRDGLWVLSGWEPES